MTLRLGLRTISLLTRRTGVTKPRRWASSVAVRPGSVEGVVRLELARPPANTFTVEFFQDLENTLKDLEHDPAVQGVVFTSSSSTIFCAGIDLTELVDPDKERLELFWRSMQGFFTNLFATKLATAAAIDGHAPGGGCILALACDHRVMSRGSIGLNEAALGLPPPWWISDMLCRVVGEARGEQMLQNASYIDEVKALDVGLIDVIASAHASKTPDMPSVDIAEKRLEKLIRVPGRVGVKAERRERFVLGMRDRLENDTDGFVATITSHAMQDELLRYSASLKGRR